MQFSISSTPAESSAILYVCAPELTAENLNQPIVRLLHQQLTDKSPFQSARVPQENDFAEYAVIRLPEDKSSIWEKNSKEAAVWAAKQTHLTVVADGLSADQAAQILPILVLALGEATYRFDDYKTEKKPVQLQSVVFNFGSNNDELQTILLQTQSLYHGIRLCKDLGNMPPNICTPGYLAQVAEKEAASSGANIKILGADYIRQNMGAFWSVAKGSVQEPRLIELSYFGAADKNAAPTILVGKGITFDTGGISLKPGEGMDEMKYDMCGAATVIGTLIAAARAKLPINLMAIVPTCENMPDGAASKPGDIITTMNGTTVEILNTDAEGRLILCDALTYAEQFKPAAVIDVATLTGACIIALGHAASGLAANDQNLADALLAAGRESGDKAWQLPLFDEYREQLQSNFADLQNIGGRPAGTLTAASFLAHFMQQQKWAHLDIAGTAWKSGKDKGATGRPVPLLWAYLQQLAA